MSPGSFWNLVVAVCMTLPSVWSNQLECSVGTATERCIINALQTLSDESEGIQAELGGIRSLLETVAENTAPEGGDVDECESNPCPTGTTCVNTEGSYRCVAPEANPAATYTRWGRTTCPDISGTEIIYFGSAAGAHYSHGGGGSNFLCLPPDPEWNRYNDAPEVPRSLVYGAEYEISGDGRFPFYDADGPRLHDNEVPCAVCLIQRGTVLMIPGKMTCPAGWTQEYQGYLMSEHYNHPGKTEFVCVDGEPEVQTGGTVNENGALFYPVEGRCGSLQCPPYVDGRELTCIVCSK